MSAPNIAKKVDRRKLAMYFVPTFLEKIVPAVIQTRFAVVSHHDAGYGSEQNKSDRCDLHGFGKWRTRKESGEGRNIRNQVFC